MFERSLVPSLLDLDYRLGLKMSRTILTATQLMLVFFTGSVLAIDAEALFKRNCAQCHGANLGGSAHGTALKGPAFKKKMGQSALASTC